MNPEVYPLHPRDLRSILVPALPGWGNTEQRTAALEHFM
jgi:hypothetical protein